MFSIIIIKASQKKKQKINKNTWTLFSDKPEANSYHWGLHPVQQESIVFTLICQIRKFQTRKFADSHRYISGQMRMIQENVELNKNQPLNPQP